MGTARDRHRGRWFATCVTAAVAVLLGLLVGAPGAHAEEGLAVSSQSRYVLDLEEGTVQGSITMTLRNVTPNEPTADGFRYFFYDAYGIPLPAGATDVQARSGDGTLRTASQRLPEEPGFRLIEIQFPDLLYQESRTIELTFTLEGQPPRSDDPTRIGPGHANFAVFGPGDAGANSVGVVVDSELEFDSTESDFDTSEGEGTTTYTFTEDNIGGGISAMVSVRTSEVGEGTQVTVGGVDLVLIPYPNDPEWADFIETWADRALPVLESLVGHPWPGDIDRIRQDVGSQVRGFDGWYSTSEREIVLGEALDDGVLNHELAHAWVNTATIPERWLSEGLAEVLAERTATRTGGSFTVPATVNPDDEHALPLYTWLSSRGFRGTETDSWAYPASYQVATALLAGLDDDLLTPLLSDVVTSSSPWDLPGRRDLSGGGTTTTAFLDLLAAHETPSVVDGSAIELYRTWVLEGATTDLLDQWQPVGAKYEEYAGAAPWGAPLGLRRSMSGWEFAQAIEMMNERAGLPPAAAGAQAVADRLHLDLPDRLRQGYEQADSAADYDALSDSLQDASRTLERYADARASADAERDLLGRIGALPLRLAATADVAAENIRIDEFAASRSASDLVIERGGAARMVGAAILGGVALVLLLLIGLSVFIARRSRSEHPLPGERPVSSPSSPRAESVDT